MKDDKKSRKNKDLDETSLGKLAQKYGYDSLRKACNKVDDLKGEGKSYSCIQKYLTGRSKKFNEELIPFLLQAFEGCSEEELKQAIRDSKSNNFISNDDFKEEEYELTEKEKEYIEKDYDYVVSRIHTTAIYGADKSLFVTKTVTIKALVDNLDTVTKLAHYRVVKEKDAREPEFSHSNNIKTQTIWRPDREENYIEIILKEALKKGQEVTLFLRHSFEKVLDEDMTFHYLLITAPTYYTALTVIPPPYVPVACDAALNEYEREDFCKIDREGKLIKKLMLSQSRTYFWEKTYPDLYHCYKIIWGDESAVTKKHKEMEAIAQEKGFIALEVDTHIIYADNNIIETHKAIKIKCLAEKLEKIEKLIYSKIVRGDKSFDKNASPNCLAEFIEEYSSDKNEIYINVFFKEALRKGQEVTLFLCGRFEKVLDEDRTSHYTSVLFPTLYMRLSVTPPSYVTKGHIATLSEYESEKMYLRLIGEDGKYIKKLALDESGNYEHEEYNVLPYSWYQIFWGK